jgi:hypothetical protein
MFAWDLDDPRWDAPDRRVVTSVLTDLGSAKTWTFSVGLAGRTGTPCPTDTVPEPDIPEFARSWGVERVLLSLADVMQADRVEDDRDKDS